MSQLKLFRDRFGITQEAFAAILQCHTTQLTMSESGRRSLPQESRKILRHLEQAVEQYFENITNSNSLSKDDATFLNKQIKNYEAELAILDLKKETTIKRIVIAKEQGKLLAALRDSPLPTELEEAHLQLQILERNLPNKIKKLHRELILINLKMGGLHGELDAALVALEKK